MDYFNKLPGFRRSPAGLEWQILRRLHLITLLGTLLPLLFLAAIYLLADMDPRDFKLLAIFVISLIILHWTLVMVLGIACWIISLMKGPAYVADPYHRPDVDDPDEPVSPFDVRSR